MLTGGSKELHTINWPRYRALQIFMLEIPLDKTIAIDLSDEIALTTNVRSG
jgi:hypothetical protein